MRFIIFVIDDQSNSGNPDEMSQIDTFNDRLQLNGHWVLAAGIGNPATAQLLDNRGGAAKVEFGSLFKGMDHYSGFWIIEAPDHDAAATLAAEGSKACNRRVELRPFLR